MHRPLVSVVMVVCNVDRFLAEAIESILNQSMRDLEFIIVDFGSKDRSKAIVSDYATKDSRIESHEIPHCGLAEARNAGCFLAKSDYIAIMDADDVAVEKRLEWQIEFMQKYPDVGVVGGGVQWIDAQGTKLREAYNPCDNSEIQAHLLYHSPIWQPTVLMRRAAFVSTGGYREAFAPSEDYDLWLRIAERYDLANLPQILLKYRMHPAQVSIRKRRQQTLGFLGARASASYRRRGDPDPLDSVKEITTGLLQGLGVDESAIQKSLANEYLMWMRHLFLATEYSSALEVYFQALQSSNSLHAKKTMVDVRLMAAQIYWKQKKFLKSLICAGGAFIRRPLVAGRAFKAIFRSLQSNSHDTGGFCKVANSRSARNDL